MSVAKHVSQRNPAVECCRMVAALAVVFLHVGFPGPLGGLSNCLTRFAVPFFFGISGYYHYQADASRTRKRLISTLKLDLWSILLYFAFEGILLLIGNNPGQLRTLIPTASDLLQFLLFHVTPYSVHLWYLTALAACYLVLMVYTRLFRNTAAGYRPLYIVSLGLWGIYLYLSVFLVLSGQEVPIPHYRNGWLMGLPMFTMGLFLREYGPRLLSRLTLPWQFGLMGAGLFLSVLQGLLLSTTETPVGMFLFVPVLILFLVSHPLLISPDWLFTRKFVPRFGNWSAGLYIGHMLFYKAYMFFLKEPLIQRLGSAEEWLRPIAITIVSLLAAAVWDLLRHPAKKQAS